ncbi:hypothetical protein HPB52_010580 [Rhipicephalus sanguineus]|uniref:MADF domain-containing protein n=1 Tax=Rhipicephalus sanguineus TaxID=34632 RepID=A0A9D4SPK3_RHISA|nr:hypothetical protein HPB52_010580 [Rhipicephalus sanguineus]
MSEPAVVISVELLLLDTINHHPVLYDKTNPRYKEAECKKEIWKTITQDMGVTAAREEASTMATNSSSSSELIILLQHVVDGSATMLTTYDDNRNARARSIGSIA